MSSRYLIVTDGQTDGQTDGRTDESNLITALCTSASRGKNYSALQEMSQSESETVCADGDGEKLRKIINPNHPSIYYA